jgi:hypothetical protein
MLLSDNTSTGWFWKVRSTEEKGMILFLRRGLIEGTVTAKRSYRPENRREEEDRIGGNQPFRERILSLQGKGNEPRVFVTKWLLPALMGDGRFVYLLTPIFPYVKLTRSIDMMISQLSQCILT